MVKYYAAYNCSNLDTALNRKQGITFHRFPKDNRRKQEWAQAPCCVDPKINTPKKTRQNSKSVGAFGVPLFQAESSNNGACSEQTTPMTKHHYHITDSPKTLKKRLDELLMENDELRRRLRNTSLEEKILHKNLDVSQDSEHSKSMLRETM